MTDRAKVYSGFMIGGIVVSPGYPDPATMTGALRDGLATSAS